MSDSGDYNEGFKRRGRQQVRKPRPAYDPSVPLTDAQRERLTQRARNSALWYLSRTDRTRRELEQRLRRKPELPPDIITKVLDDLEAIKYIDDSRVAENFVRTGSEYRGLGRQGLANELRRKGITGEVIEAAVVALDAETEEENARDLVRKKMRHSGRVEPQKRVNQLVGMLARKGYSPASAFRIVREELAAEEHEVLEELPEDNPFEE